jgi:hypothetical protein
LRRLIDIRRIYRSDQDRSTDQRPGSISNRYIAVEFIEWSHENAFGAGHQHTGLFGVFGSGLGNTALQPKHQQKGIPAMVTTRAEAAQYVKDAGGLKLVVFGADGHEVAAMFVHGSVTYDQEEATFIVVAEDGHAVGELFVDETVGYDESTDAFVIRTAQ